MVAFSLRDRCGSTDLNETPVLYFCSSVLAVLSRDVSRETKIAIRCHGPWPPALITCFVVGMPLARISDLPGPPLNESRTFRKSEKSLSPATGMRRVDDAREISWTSHPIGPAFRDLVPCAGARAARTFCRHTKRDADRAWRSNVGRSRPCACSGEGTGVASAVYGGVRYLPDRNHPNRGSRESRLASGHSVMVV